MVDYQKLRNFDDYCNIPKKLKFLKSFLHDVFNQNFPGLCQEVSIKSNLAFGRLFSYTCIENTQTLYTSKCSLIM